MPETLGLLVSNLTGFSLEYKLVKYDEGSYAAYNSYFVEGRVPLALLKDKKINSAFYIIVLFEHSVSYEQNYDLVLFLLN